MSRRHTARTVETDAADTTPEHARQVLHQWEPEYATEALKVVELVWHRQGAKLYAPHRDALLRDDLKDWLLVQAVTIADRWENYDLEDPLRSWHAYLYASLTTAARWHFTHAVRTAEAQAAHNRGILSTQHLDDLEADTGYAIPRHALHGDDWSTSDPASILVRTEDLARDIERAGRHLREAQGSGTYTTATTACSELGCDLKAGGDGLCLNHRQQQRRLWGGPNPTVCNVPECPHPTYSRGLCSRHYDKLRKGRLPDDLQQHVAAKANPGGKR